MMSCWYAARANAQSKAQALLRDAGLFGGRPLDNGITDWEGQGFTVDRGVQRWELERQVRLVAGSIVLSSVWAAPPSRG